MITTADAPDARGATQPEGAGASSQNGSGSGFSSDFLRMVDSFFSSDQPRFCPINQVWNPPTDIYETADFIHIKMDVAGVSEGHIQVKVKDDYVVIRGQRVDDSDARRENFHLMEIPYGKFERVFQISASMNAADVSATVAKGFLRVTIPKHGSARKRRVPVD